jgi:subtilase family serine protease
VIAVRNDGRGDAGPFDVGLRIGGRDALLVTVAGAMAGQSQPLTFVGPRCVAGERVRIEADPGDRVAEADERDNVLSLDCPV